MLTPRESRYGVIVLGVLMVFAAGCGSNPQDATTEALIENAAKQSGESIDVKVDSTGDAPYTMKMKTEEGEIAIKSTDPVEGNSFTIETKSEDGVVKFSSGAEASIPATFPEDIPLPPDLEVRTSHELAEKKQYNLQVVTSSSADEVASFFETEIPAKGWAEDSRMDQMLGTQPMKMRIYKKDNRILNIMITTDKDKTSVNVTTTEQ